MNETPWNETPGLLRRFWAKICQGSQLKFVQFLGHQQAANAGNGLPVAELGKPLGVVERLHEDLAQLLLILGLLVLLLPMLKQHVHL